MNPLDLLSPYKWLIYGGFALAVVFGGAVLIHRHDEAQRDIGRAEVQAKWDKERAAQQAAALAESQAKAKETLRRIEAQARNEDEKDRELAQARAAAQRNAADADRVREQSAATAREWATRLADSPTSQECKAAGGAIVLQADMLGRVDRAASELAAYADSARAAGLKCQADYNALTAR